MARAGTMTLAVVLLFAGSGVRAEESAVPPRRLMCSEALVVWSRLANQVVPTEDLVCEYLENRARLRRAELAARGDYSSSEGPECAGSSFDVRDTVRAGEVAIRDVREQLAAERLFRVTARVPWKEYDPKRHGYPLAAVGDVHTYFAVNDEWCSARFPTAKGGVRVRLANANVLGFLAVPEASARAFEERLGSSRDGFVLELVVVPVSARLEKVQPPRLRDPVTGKWVSFPGETHRLITANVVSARIEGDSGDGHVPLAAVRVNDGSKSAGKTVSVEVLVQR